LAGFQPQGSNRVAGRAIADHLEYMPVTKQTLSDNTVGSEIAH